MAKVFFKPSFLKLHEIDVSNYNKFQNIEIIWKLK